MVLTFFIRFFFSVRSETSKAWSKRNRAAIDIINVVEVALAVIHEFVKEIYPRELAEPIKDALVKMIGDAVYTLSHFVTADEVRDVTVRSVNCYYHRSLTLTRNNDVASRSCCLLYLLPLFCFVY